jgi:hypothetical protein
MNSNGMSVFGWNPPNATNNCCCIDFGGSPVPAFRFLQIEDIETIEAVAKFAKCFLKCLVTRYTKDFNKHAEKMTECLVFVDGCVLLVAVNN